MLADARLRDVLAAFASPAPTPAGGSASALASAVGVSLLMMAASLPRTRDGSDEDRRLLTAVLPALTSLQQQLSDAIDRDADAYARVVSARGDQRQAAIAAAIDVPLQVMRWSLEALKVAAVVAARCHRPASSDVRVGIELLDAGLTGARSSVRANLGSVGDEQSIELLRAEVARLSDEAGAAVEAAHGRSDSSEASPRETA
jgi:formiminotetrahydrofolate cyclodeaminase